MKNPVHSKSARAWHTALPVALFLCLSAGTERIVADPSQSEPHHAPAGIAADERNLWLLLGQQRQTRIFHRAIGGKFDFGRLAGGRVAIQTVVDGDLLVFFYDGTAYRYVADRERAVVEAVLPGREIPDALIAQNRRIYAVVSSEAARQLPVWNERAESEETPATFDPGGATLSLALYDGRIWHAVAPLPAVSRPELVKTLKPRLCIENETLALLIPTVDREHLAHYRFDAEQREWIAGSALTIPQADNFWLLVVDRIPTLIVLTRDRAQHAQLHALRQLPSSDVSAGINWETANLTYSPLPVNVDAIQVSDMAAFNQHLCLLVQDANGDHYLRFAHLTRQPVEPTVELDRMLADQRRALRNQGFLRLISLLLLPAVLVGLFVFRRGSMVRQLELPPNVTPASAFRRATAWAIDFLPITVAAGYATGQPWHEGLSTLFRWSAISSDLIESAETQLLYWWGATMLAYMFYGLIMESFAGRTLGKIAMHLHVLAESGLRPTLLQLCTRNFIRLVELIPQFWIFGVLVLLSRNRQRLGDIFARTIVVRHLGIPPSASQKNETAPRNAPSERQEDNPSSRDSGTK